jgi:hypothetical protein
MSSTYRYRTDMSNPVPANNRAICIERRQRILSPKLTRTPLSWWTNITARICQSRRPRRHVWAAEDKEIAEDQDRGGSEIAEARDGMSCRTAAVPVKRGFGTGFVPLGFLCTARLSELADSREGTEERESHDVLLGVAGLWRSLRAPGGTRLERGIM